jgi:heme a synthase
MTPSPTQLSRLTAGLAASTFALVVFGAAVRVHGAGLACPDWPLCFGEVIPPIDFKVFMEFGHRVLAGLISVGFLGVFAATVRGRSVLGSRSVWLAVLAGVALLTQVILGGLTVLELLAEWTVTSHLITGNTFCTLLLLLALSQAEAGRPVRRAAVGWAGKGLAVSMLVLVPAQVALGGLVASSYAGLACGTWPTCDGTNWFPTFAGLVGLQLTHRLVGYVLLVVAGLGAALASGRLRAPARMLFVLVVLQAVVGVANVLLRLPVEVTLLHSAGAASIFLTMAWLNWEALRAPLAARATDAALAMEST